MSVKTYGITVNSVNLQGEWFEAFIWSIPGVKSPILSK
jgi:hypothetical protein